MPIENNQNRPITPGESSHYAHLPPPLSGDLTMIFQDPVIRRNLYGLIQRYREIEMTGGTVFTPDDLINIIQDPVIRSNFCLFIQRYMAIGLTPGQSSRSAHLSPPLPGDQINILQNSAFHRPNEEMNQRFVREEIHVREELGHMSHNNLPPPRSSPDQTNKALYCLVFLNKVKDRIYANYLVRAEKGDPIKVAICDMLTKSVITTDCSLSSAIVFLTVLDAEFSENKRETWSMNEFNKSVLRGRNGKGPILTGPHVTIHLENGIGTFENIIFNDNSSWSKHRSIRLGVMVKGEGEQGYLNGKRVQEGVSKSFRVFDRRSKASEKLKRLKLTDKVLYIVKIGTRRANDLKNYNIKTVKDFLWWYYNNESTLRQILNIKRDSAKEWLSMVDHVKQCADEFRAKYNASNNSSHPQQASVHPTERNMPLSTNGGRLVVGLGSSEPNPSGNNSIEAGVPAINRQRFPMWHNGHTRNNFLFEPFSSENGDSMQPTNGGLVVRLGSSSSELNPSENNRIEAGMPMPDNGHTRNNVRFEPFSSENGDSMQPTNGGLVVGLGSSEPNPSENNRIEGLPQYDLSFDSFSFGDSIAFNGNYGE